MSTHTKIKVELFSAYTALTISAIGILIIIERIING
jgi:hypothetical protein